jgi:hypothetical protein
MTITRMRMGYTPHSSSDLAPAHLASDPQLGIALKLAKFWNWEKTENAMGNETGTGKNYY